MTFEDFVIELQRRFGRELPSVGDCRLVEDWALDSLEYTLLEGLCLELAPTIDLEFGHLLPRVGTAREMYSLVTESQ